MVSWGGWEYSGGNGMRCGLEVHVEGGIGHGDPSCKITVEYWTENQFTYSDSQSLNLGGAIGGSIGYSNNQGGAPIQRGTRTYWYEYGPNEYKTNAQRTFSATVNGAFNGVTPSKSVTVNIPDRPYAAPAAPSSAAASRISDESNKVTWNNRPSAGEPYDGVKVERYTYDHQTWTQVASLGATAETYSDAGAIPNRRYQYRVRAYNNIGHSGYDNTGDLYTSPATPTGVTRTQTDSTHQQVAWNDNVDYTAREHQVYASIDGAADVLVYTGNTSPQTFTTDASKKYKYRVRAKTTTGITLYSSMSAYTTESSGTTTAPNAPTNLAPTDNLVMDPTGPIVLSWQHNATDGKGQTKYEVQHREVGATPWTSDGQITSATTNTTIDPNVYGYSKTVEWQVRTWGTDPNPSAWSALATFKTQAAVPVKYPLVLDLTSGRIEADSAGATAGTSGQIESWTGIQTANQNISSTTAVVLTGASVTIPVSGPSDMFYVDEVCDAQWVSGLNNGYCELFVDGVAQVGRIAFRNDGGSIVRATNHQSHLITGLAAGSHVFELRALVTTAGTTWTYVGGNTGLRVIKLQAPRGPAGPQGIPGQGAPTVGARIYLAATVAQPASTTTVPWDAVDWASPAAMADIAGDRIVIQEEGDYLIRGYCQFNGTGTSSYRAVHIEIDGTFHHAQRIWPSTTSDVYCTAVMVKHLTAGQVIKISAANAGTAGNLVGSATAVGSTFEVIKLHGAKGDKGDPGAGVTDGDKGDITVSGGGATWNIDPGAVGSTEIGIGSIFKDHIVDGEVTLAKLNADTKNLAAGTPSLRKLGTGATDAAAGDHAHAAVPLTVQDENVDTVTNTNVLDFQGTGVSVAAGAAGEAVVTVPGPTGLISSDADNFHSASAAGIGSSVWTSVTGFARVGNDPGYVTCDGTTFVFTKAGTYLITGTVNYGGGGSGSPRRIAGIFINGTVSPTNEAKRNENVGIATGTTQVTHVHEAKVGDTVNFMFWQNAVTTMTLTAVPGQDIQITPLAGFSSASVATDTWLSSFTGVIASSTFTNVGGFARVGADPGYISAYANGQWTFAKAGTYLVVGTVHMTSSGAAVSTAGRRLARMHLNGTEVRRQDNMAATAWGGEVVAVVEAKVGDVLLFDCWQNSGGNLNFSSPDMRMQFTPLYLAAPPTTAYARLYKTGNQSIPNATFTTVTFSGTEYSSPSTMAETANSGLRIPVTGIYTITGYVNFDVNGTTGHRTAVLLRNGTVIRYQRAFPNSGAQAMQAATTTRLFTAGDLITLQAYHGAGSATDVIGGVEFTCLEAVLVNPV